MNLATELLKPGRGIHQDFSLGMEIRDYGRSANLAYFNKKDPHRIFVVTDLISSPQGDNEHSDPLLIPINAIQELMDCMWEKGMRPKALTKALNSPGIIIPMGPTVLEVTQQHLADTRALLADRTGVKL